MDGHDPSKLFEISSAICRLYQLCQKMRPDAHKAKASLKWKLKHHIPIKRTDDSAKTVQTGRPFQRRTLESNSYRYEQQDETIEGI